MRLNLRFSPVFRAMCLLGGSPSSLVRRNWRNSPNLTFVADVRDAIARTKLSAPTGSDIRYVSLGDGHTADTLFRDAWESVQSVIAQCGALIAATGLGQARRIGAQCTSLLCASYEFRKFTETLRDKIRIDTGGAPESIQLSFHCSGAGGTGAGAIVVLAAAFVEALLPLEVPIEISIDRCRSTNWTRTR